MGRTRRYIPKPPSAPREPSAHHLLANLQTAEAAGLAAVVELRGFGEHDLADMLCDVIERIHTIHAAAEVRLQGAVPFPTGGASHG